ncbi:MAG: diaminopimelate decarboxylase, partial [Cyanobacteria bacterium J06576_12]
MVSTVSAAPQRQSAQASSLQYLAEVDAHTSPNQNLLPLSAAVNDQDHLVVGGCDVLDLVKEFGSPLYILDEQTARTACRQYKQSF